MSKVDPVARASELVLKSTAEVWRGPVVEESVTLPALMLRAAMCWGVVILTMPALAVMERGAEMGEPVSVRKLAVPPLLVKLGPEDQDWGPDWEKVPVLVEASAETRVPPFMKVPLLA